MVRQNGPIGAASRLIRVAGIAITHSAIHHLRFSLSREWMDCPSLRASSDHRLIVGALRARRTVCLLLHIFLRPHNRVKVTELPEGKKSVGGAGEHNHGLEGICQEKTKYE